MAVARDVMSAQHVLLCFRGPNAAGSTLTPANTLVISRTLMPARGPSLWLFAIDARHLRQILVRPTNEEPVRVKGLNRLLKEAPPGDISHE